MKKLTLSLWLALAAAGIIAIQALPSSHANVRSVSHLPAGLSPEVEPPKLAAAPLGTVLPREIIIR